MKKLGQLVMTAILTAMIAFSTQAIGQGNPRILLIPREGYSADLDLMIKMEIGVMKVLLKNAGLDVDVATTSGMPILGTTEKVTDIKQLRNVKVDDYAGVIIACMAVGGGNQPYPPVPAEVISIVKKALADGKPVAANGNAVVVLAEAGVLKGKNYSYMRDPLKPTAMTSFTIPAFQDAVYKGNGLVQDGRIMTSGVCANIEKTMGMENGTAKLTKAFIAAVKA